MSYKNFTSLHPSFCFHLLSTILKMPKIFRKFSHQDAMGCDPTVEKLKKKNNLFPLEFQQFHVDFLAIYIFVKFKYVRNVFRREAEFQKKNFNRTPFDYDYANQNETPTRFLAIQSQLAYFNRLVDSSSPAQQRYCEFVREAMEELVEDIIVPIEDVFLEIQELVKKYKKKKPSRLIMDAVRRLLGEM